LPLPPVKISMRCWPNAAGLCSRARDKVNLDIFWLRDESLEDTANLPNPDILAGEIIEDLQAALEQFTAIAEDVGE
jgi:type I restriction enzyme M protein